MKFSVAVVVLLALFLPRGVDQWRPLVEQYFPPGEVDTALAVMKCESGGNPDAVGPTNDHGLFQHVATYWPGRSEAAGWGGADIYDPEANVAVAAWLQATGGWGHWVCYRLLFGPAPKKRRRPPPPPPEAQTPVACDELADLLGEVGLCEPPDEWWPV